MTIADHPDELIVRAPFDWTAFALCVGKTDLFFGPPGERPSKRRKRERLARAYCDVCPVKDTCREQGRANFETGMWGGENDEERARAGAPPRGAVRRSIAAAAREGREELASPDADGSTDIDELDLHYLAVPVV